MTYTLSVHFDASICIYNLFNKNLLSTLYVLATKMLEIYVSIPTIKTYLDMPGRLME